MFSYLLRKLRFRQLRNGCESKEEVPEREAQAEFSQSLEENLGILSRIIKQSGDVVIRRFSLGRPGRTQAALLYLDGMVDRALVHENIIKPLMLDSRLYPSKEGAADEMAQVKNALVFAGNLRETSFVQKAVDCFLSGDTVVLIDGADKALVVGLRGWKSRGIEEPKTETTIRGSREGFTETLRDNTSMLRRRIKSPDFVLEPMTLGARTRTDICIAYLDGVADPALIAEIKKRLGRIHTDSILESGYLEAFIEDAPYSIFSTVGNSEKPDKVAAKLLEGRAAILVDGTPFVLTVPMLFVESFQASEDYYSRPLIASLIRLTRYLAYFISILAPALYVALTTFHQELIPTPLLLTMAAAREGIPFPAVVEAGIMIVAFEILREAGVRLPRSVGQAISIVGALVIGESAVSAGLIGAPMVIVVSLTAVSSFVVPPQADSGAVLRYTLLILAGAMGGYGIAIGLFAAFVHMASLRSFGAPYLSPLAPFEVRGMKDALIRAPLWTMHRRPKNIGGQNPVRQGGTLKPHPPENTGGRPNS